MRYVIVTFLLVGCADKASVEALHRENAALKERMEKLEAGAVTAPVPPTAKEHPTTTAKTGHEADAGANAVLVAALDRKIAGMPSSVGVKYDDILDEHGRFRDLKTLAAAIKAKLAGRGAEGEWRLLADWLGLPAAAVVMNGTASGASTEEPLQPDRVFELIEQHVQGHAGALAVNLGVKLSETVGADGHFKDPRDVCTRIRDWYAKRGEQGHAMLLDEYGRMGGTEIWKAAICTPKG